MGKNIGQNIVNMIKCREGEHVLFRSYGLGADVDSTHGWSFGRVSVAMARWYPATKLKNLSVNKANINGEFSYTIDVEGV